jgi:hypothetical protein
MEINKNIWLKYLKTYESFNKDIPDGLKYIFNEVRNKIGEQKDSFDLDINLNDFDFCDLILNIKVEFNKLNSGIRYEDKDIIYYSNLNIDDIIRNKDKTTIPVKISDVCINSDKLSSVLSHEIRHIYDIYTINDESDMKSFMNSMYYSELSKNENNEQFLNFLRLIYLSLEHELIARNTMIWEMFINCKCSKIELYKLYKESFMYKSLTYLNDFKYDQLLKIDDILLKVNNFINYFGGNLCKSDDDINFFFINWSKYFKKKSDEYIKDGYKIIDDLIQLNEFKHNTAKVKNVKEILLEIHNKYILKKPLN